MNNQKINIWLDCDVGNDDSMAVILSLFDPKANLVAISSSYGNTSLENCTNNTLKLLTTIDCMHIPVLKGASHPIKKQLAKTDMHGALGLFGSENLSKKFEAIDNISHFDLIQKLLGDQKFTLVITGPQTNTAKLLQSHPEVLNQITEIVFMGGTSGFGNITPSAEYNIYSDPEAAQYVLDTCKQHQVKLTMIALDLTYTCLVYDDIEQKIKDINTRFSDWVVHMLSEYRIAYRKQEFDHTPLHDPLAVFYALYPEYFVTKPYYVVVDCESSLSYGRTLVDKNYVYGLDPNVEFGRSLQVDNFWEHMIEAVKQASKKSQIEQQD